MTKGYGLGVKDINESCPNDLKPYSEAHKLEVCEQDSMVHAICGDYILSAVSVAVGTNLHGKKYKQEYTKELITSKAMEEFGLTEDEIIEKEIKKAMMAEQQYMAIAGQKGLPETIIK